MTQEENNFRNFCNFCNFRNFHHLQSHPQKTKMLKPTLFFRELKKCRTFAPEISKRAAVSLLKQRKNSSCA